MAGSRATNVSETQSLPLRLHHHFTDNSPYTTVESRSTWLNLWMRSQHGYRRQLYCTVGYKGLLSHQKAWSCLIWKVTLGVGLKMCVIPVLGEGEKERWDTRFTSEAFLPVCAQLFGSVLAWEVKPGRLVVVEAEGQISLQTHLEERLHIQWGEPTWRIALTPTIQGSLVGPSHVLKAHGRGPLQQQVRWP